MYLWTWGRESYFNQGQTPETTEGGSVNLIILKL